MSWQADQVEPINITASEWVIIAIGCVVFLAIVFGLATIIASHLFAKCDSVNETIFSLHGFVA